MALRKAGAANLDGPSAEPHPVGLAFEALLNDAKARKIVFQGDRTPPEAREDMALAEIDKQRREGKSDIQIWFDAIRIGDLDILGAMIRNPPEGFDVNWNIDDIDPTSESGDLGMTGLGEAVFGFEDPAVVRLLVEEGKIDIAHLDGSGRSAYQLALDRLENYKDRNSYNISDEQATSLLQMASFLKDKLDAEAQQALEANDMERLGALVDAGAEDLRPREPGVPGADIERPYGDDRTAQEIIDANPVLQNLSEADAEFLKWGRYAFGHEKGDAQFQGYDVEFEGVGDFRVDADAAYRAAAVLNHIEHFDADGNVIIAPAEPQFEGGEGYGQIDGWTRPRDEDGSEAKPNTEAGRFQDLMRYGYSSLKGDALPNGLPPEFGPPPEDFAKPETDTRSAEEILASSEVYQNLSFTDREALKMRLGDIHSDPAAAYAAVSVLDHIVRYDTEGNIIRNSEGVVNNSIDGWTKADRRDIGSQAEEGTEAGRFQDFIKFGWERLKFNTDPAANVDYGDLLGLAEAAKTDANKFNELIMKLKEGAYNSIVGEAGLPPDKSDLLANPDNYGTEDRGAAIIELQLMRQNIMSGLDKYTQPNVLGNNHLSEISGFELNTDPTQVVAKIDEAIGRLSNADVGAWIENAEAAGLQELVGADPKLKPALEALMNGVKDDAVGLDAAIDLEGDITDNMRSYLANAQTLNLAAGKDGGPIVEDLTIDIRETKNFDAIVQAYEESLGNPNVLGDLVEGGMSEEEAMTELTSRSALFAAFGSPPGDLSASVNANIQQYYLDNTDESELEGIVLVKNDETGEYEIDVPRLEEIIDGIRESDPESAYLRGDNGEELTNVQIITGVRNAWDSLRAPGKLNHQLSKAGAAFMSENNPIRQVYGYGGMHFVSGLLASAAMIAKGAAGDSGDAAIAGAVGSGMQVLGLAGETFLLSNRLPIDGGTRLDLLREKWNRNVPNGVNDQRPFNNGTRDWTINASQANSVVGHATNLSRFVTASGGSMILGASIVAGLEEMKKGNTAGAAVYFTAGAANAASAPFAFAQSLFPYLEGLPKDLNGGRLTSSQIARWTTRAAIMGGAAGSVANPLAFLAMIGYEIYASVKDEKEAKQYFESFVPVLGEYGITGGEDPWYDEPAPETIAS